MNDETPPPFSRVNPSAYRPHQPAEPDLVLPDHPSAGEMISALLRSPRSLAKHCQEPKQASRVALIFILIAFLTHALFGVVLGTFALGEQLWISPAKMIIGTVFTSVICFPSLFIFSCMSGARFSLPQLVAALASTLALTGLLLVGFAPALWIFAQATDLIAFVGFLAIAAWGVAFTFGIRYFNCALSANGPISRTPIHFWALVFILVALQMTTTLRPFIGTSPEFFTLKKRFFLEHWSRSGYEWEKNSKNLEKSKQAKEGATEATSPNEANEPKPHQPAPPSPPATNATPPERKPSSEQ